MSSAQTWIVVTLGLCVACETDKVQRLLGIEASPLELCERVRGDGDMCQATSHYGAYATGRALLWIDMRKNGDGGIESACSVDILSFSRVSDRDKELDGIEARLRASDKKQAVEFYVSRKRSIALVVTRLDDGRAHTRAALGKLDRLIALADAEQEPVR